MEKQVFPLKFSLQNLDAYYSPETRVGVYQFFPEVFVLTCEQLHTGFIELPFLMCNILCISHTVYRKQN